MVFKVVIALEQFAEEPTALNSNLFPVNAKGEVLFLSVLSKGHLDFTYNVQLQVGFPLEIIFQQ
jgi:hypothetical protein